MAPKRKTDTKKTLTAVEILKDAIESGAVRSSTKSKLFPEENIKSSSTKGIKNELKEEKETSTKGSSKATKATGVKREREPSPAALEAVKSTANRNKKGTKTEQPSSDLNNKTTKTEPLKAEHPPSPKSEEPSNVVVKKEAANHDEKHDDPEDKVIIEMSQFADVMATAKPMTAAEKRKVEREAAKDKAAAEKAKKADLKAALGNGKKEKCALCDLWNTEWEFCGKTGKRHIEGNMETTALTASA